MTDLEYLRRMLLTSNKSAVARAVGLSGRTVRDIASGKTESPSCATLYKLIDYFRSTQDGEK